MDGRALAGLLGPLVGPAARERIRALAMGQSTLVSLRYDEIRDWKLMNKLTADHAEELELFDGEEWFTLEIRRSDNENGG